MRHYGGISRKVPFESTVGILDSPAPPSWSLRATLAMEYDGHRPIGPNYQSFKIKLRQLKAGVSFFLTITALSLSGVLSLRLFFGGFLIVFNGTSVCFLDRFLRNTRVSFSQPCLTVLLVIDSLWKSLTILPQILTSLCSSEIPNKSTFTSKWNN